VSLSGGRQEVGGPLAKSQTVLIQYGIHQRAISLLSTILPKQCTEIRLENQDEVTQAESQSMPY